MDHLRAGAIQTLTATMDDAKEQHEQQISQVSRSLFQQQLEELQKRAQRARQLEGKDEWQSVATEKSSDDDFPALEGIAPKRVSNSQKARVRLTLNRCIDEDKKTVQSQKEFQICKKQG